ncbi:ribonuclease J [Acetohalobium arabaticum]|uniref:Ribonuclease J n=1 Tax=Acetohalobium arabaticum (strain ATCC 49924 / DSM 5501 / Z-7288) TaxID=574087 RepID=D9QRD9_ACEAZ|nr:ribonuclease J [Acetohalobium arabaticum]ADL13080.1 RNA-metabolising metallo-beta-lactamase [Acetohalobium arabaticum DSM 5501]
MSNNQIDKLSCIPLGGVSEIGKNMMVVEIEDEILIIDAGIMFPEDDLLGIDLVIPDMTYLKKNRDRIKGIVLTHGHLDHIGALPYLLKEINVPVYGTKLTLGLVRGNLEEHGLLKDSYLKHVYPGHTAQIGEHFNVEFIRVNHSIADACALAVHTPVGTLVYASDFKFDQTPVNDQMADIHRLAELGQEGVLALFSDSTNAEREGYTMSEKVVGETIDEIFSDADGRIIVASFASNIDRIQQFIDSAFNQNRKVAVTGRSMINNVEIASELGYLDIPDGMLVDLDELKDLRDDQIALITTGSQGEPMAALTRMSRGDHRQINIKSGDTVVVSATAIPGNEKSVGKTINKLFKRGADVIYESVSGVHVSGHASQEELKLMLNLVQPEYFIPVHGEYRHMHCHAKLAREVGIPEENIFINEPGNVMEFSNNDGQTTGSVTAGRVLVDGLGVGDVGNIVLRDRRLLSQDGVLIVVVTIDDRGQIVAGPDIISRGFVYIRESGELISAATRRVEKALSKCEQNNVTEWSILKSEIKDALGSFIYHKIERRPMILPIIMEV